MKRIYDYKIILALIVGGSVHLRGAYYAFLALT